MRSKSSSVESRFSFRSLFRSALIIPLVGAFLVTLAGCSDNPVGSGEDRVEAPRKNSNTFQVEGTVAQQRVNGAKAWVIKSTDGQIYLPLNFKTETLRGGLKIRAEVQTLKSQLVEDRRDEIGRDLPEEEIPEEEIIDRYPSRLVQIKSIEVLGGTNVDTNLMADFYPVTWGDLIG